MWKSVFERLGFWKYGVLSGVASYPGDIPTRFGCIRKTSPNLHLYWIWNQSSSTRWCFIYKFLHKSITESGKMFPWQYLQRTCEQVPCLTTHTATNLFCTFYCQNFFFDLFTVDVPVLYELHAQLPPTNFSDLL